ncbi:MAG: outer membrane protein transport protein [Bacteroidales bacterium]|nr:outer membrane protein transport protein [Bacteroidales bacterium]
MKKIIALTTAVMLTTFMTAQNRYDALRYSQNFYEGSAKSIAMGNAMTSIGGDLGIISINPASAGVYRYSEFMLTTTLAHTLSETSYLSNESDEGFNRLGISSIGYVNALKYRNKMSSLKGLNFSISMNKLNNYNSRNSARGTTANSSWLSSVAYNTNGINSAELDITSLGDTYPFYQSGASWRSVLAWNANLLDRLPDSNSEYMAATENINGNSIIIGGPLDQRFLRETTGGLSEYDITISGNLNDKLFFGFSLGVQSLKYKDWQSYGESAVNTSLFDSKFKEFEHIYRQTTTGTGINAKAGIIFTPGNGLRLGLSLSTPTYMTLRDEWRESIYALYNDNYDVSINSPLGSYEYTIVSPAKANIGVSYIFGSRGALSFDYEGVNYAGIRMNDTESGFNSFDNENESIKNDFKNTSNIRMGAEFRPTNSLSLRAGYSYYQNPEKNYGYDTQFISCGAGIRVGNGFFADLGIQKRVSNSEEFTLYNDIALSGQPAITAPVGKSTYSAWKVLATIGFRF